MTGSEGLGKSTNLDQNIFEPDVCMIQINIISSPVFRVAISANKFTKFNFANQGYSLCAIEQQNNVKIQAQLVSGVTRIPFCCFRISSIEGYPNNVLLIRKTVTFQVILF